MKKKNRLLNALVVCALLASSTMIFKYTHDVKFPMLIGLLFMIISYAIILPKIIRISNVTTIASILASIPLLNGLDQELLKDALHKWLARNRSEYKKSDVSLMEFYFFIQGKEEYSPVCDKLGVLLLQIKVIDFKNWTVGTTEKLTEL